MKLDNIKVVSVFGAGTMGHGIAQLMATNGYKVFLRARRETSLEQGLKSISKSLDKSVEKERMTREQADAVIANITTTTDLKEAAAQADFIVESIPEKIDQKREFFNDVNEVCKDDVIIATNTSTLSITEIASAAKNPQNVIGLHFFNPVVLMKLVEIIKGLMTSDETLETTRAIAGKLGKDPITVADLPGFSVNRISISAFMEASRMLEEGVATVDDIDKGMRLGTGYRMGPFETCDLVGLDARLNNIISLYESTGDPAWRPPQMLKKLVAAGFIGNKPGSRGGYYAYFGIEKDK